MVSLDVYDAYSQQHRHKLMRAARVSRDLHNKKNLSREKNQNLDILFTWLPKRLLPGSWWESSDVGCDAKTKSGMTMG